MARVFIAVEPAGEIRDRLEQAGMSLWEANARLTLSTADQMHIRLKFLGEVPVSSIPKITTILEKSERCTIPVDCSTGQYVWPEGHQS